jgi:MoxR-like ATPase
MANINVPTALPADGSAVPFGPYCTANDVSIVTADGTTLADHLTVHLDRLDPQTVPYVNAWMALIGGTKRVEKYWRTKEYRLITPGAPKAVRAPRQPRVPGSSRRSRKASPTLLVVREEPQPVQAPTATVVVEVEPLVVTPTPTVLTPLPQAGQKSRATKKRIDGADYVIVGGITVTAADYATMLDSVDAVNAGQVGSIVVTGPSGTAKTLMVEAFAAHVGLPFVKVDGGNVRSADDWFGTLVQDPNTRVWSWHWNEFGSALLRGDACLVLLDEANRAENAAALNAVMGLLDKTGQAFVPAAMTTVHRPAGMLVVATANKGAEYVGTVPFDAAVTQRFGAGVRLDYLPAKVEVEVVTSLTDVSAATAERLVNMATQQRGLKDDISQFPSGVGISTRMLVDIAGRIVRETKRTGKDEDPRPAIRSSFNAQFDVEDEKALVNVLDSHFPASGNDTLDVDTSSITEGA